jgi:hypothetical protein
MLASPRAHGRRLLGCALASLIGALALLAPATADALVVGITDQKASTFYDARYRALGLTDSRLVVPWDWSRYRWQVKEIDSWMEAAANAGVQRPVIAFDRSRVRRDVAPTQAQYMRQFKKFRKRYPEVRDFAVWNEPNLWHQPVANKVSLIVRLYRSVNRSCARCTVLASELIDTPSMQRWAKDFQRELGHSPDIWGLHNYRDVNRRETKETRALLRITRAKVWLTETGGIVGRERGARAGNFPQTPNNAAKATRFLFRVMPKLSPRIERIYLYHWSAEKGKAWDSALLSAKGKARPAYGAFVQELKRLKVGAFRSP